MPDYGFGALAIGTGAQEGLQQLIKQRLLERQMALAEQSQAQDVDYQNRALAQRGDEVRATREAMEQSRQDALDELKRQHDMTNTLSAAGRIPYEADLDPRSAQAYEGVGLPVMKATSREQLNSPVANEYLEPDQFKAGWNKPEPKASKLMTPEEFEQWKIQKETEAKIAAKYRPPSSEAAGSWNDTGRTNAQGEAIYVNSKTLEQRAMPFGAKPAAGTGKPPTGMQRAAVKYFDRMKEAITDFSTVAPEMAKQGLAGQLQAIGPNLTQTSAQRRYNNALARFTEARLRKDSGAAVPPEEYRKDLEVYGIRPGDDAKTIAQKQRAMISTAMALAIEAGDTAMTDQYGEGWQGILQSIVGGGVGGGGDEIEYDINGNPIPKR